MIVTVPPTPRRDPPIEPSAIPFSRLLGLMPFRVPRYQRAYDWDSEEVIDFVGDVRRLYERRAAGEEGAWHFFGALISISRGDHYEVVDGQQRLATLVLALSQLARALRAAEVEARGAADEETADRAREEAEAAEAVLSAVGEPRVTLSRRDKQYFEDVLAGRATRPGRGAEQSHKRLHAAQELIRSDLVRRVAEDAGSIAERIERLATLRAAILENGYVTSTRRRYMRPTASSPC